MIKELFIVCSIVIGLTMGILLAIDTVVTYLGKCNCERTAQIIEKEYKFDWIAGCFYKENNKWVKQYYKGINNK